MRVHKSFLIKNIIHFKQQLLQWSLQEEHVIWLDSNDHDQKYSDHSGLLAVGAQRIIDVKADGAFEALKKFYNEVGDWILGYLSYDLKNDIEALDSANYDGLDFPDLFFMQPQKLFLIKGNRLNIYYLEAYADEISEDFSSIRKTKLNDQTDGIDPVKIKMRIHKDAYFQKIESLLNHIKRGDIYEANFCQEFYAQRTEIQPYETFKKLNVGHH